MITQNLIISIKIYILTGPTISATCDTVVPEAPPRYNTFLPGAM